MCNLHFSCSVMPTSTGVQDGVPDGDQDGVHDDDKDGVHTIQYNELY